MAPARGPLVEGLRASSRGVQRASKGGTEVPVMIRGLRRVHLPVWIAITLLLLAGFAAALRARRDIPALDVLPPALNTR